MDRNNLEATLSLDDSVALLAEGVDRNASLKIAVINYEVALLAEGVDRNLQALPLPLPLLRRPPRGGRG